MPSRNLKRNVVLALLLAGALGACGDDRPEALVASAKEFLAKNDYNSATIQLKNALQKSPDNAEARFLLGEALYHDRDLLGAEKEYRKALELGYPAANVNPRLAQLLLQKGDFKNVVQTFESSTGATPRDTAIIQTALSEAKLALGDTAGAGRALEAARAADTSYPPTALVAARLKASRGDLPGALAEAENAIAAAPSADAWYLKGQLLAAMRQPDKAAEAFRKSIELDKSSLLAHAALIETLLVADKGDEAAKALDTLKGLAPKHPFTYYLQAVVALRANDAKKAHEAAQFYNAQVPDDPKGMLLLATSARMLHLYGEAEANANRVLQADPKNDAARRVLVAVYLETGRAPKAMEALQPMLERGANDPRVLNLAGEVYLRNGDAATAASYFQKSSTLQPSGIEPKTGLSLARIAQGDKQGGIAELEALADTGSDVRTDLALIAITLDQRQFDKALSAIDRLEKKLPNEPMPHNLRGLALLGRGDTAGARKSFERALAVKPDYVPAAVNLARLDMAANKPADAEKRFDAILASNPSNVPALLALAGIRETTRPAKESEQTAALIRKAIAGSPTDVGPRLALVAHYLRTNEPKKALTAAQEADVAIPRTPQIIAALGQAQRAAGDASQALATYTRLSQLVPESPEPLLRMADLQAGAKDYGAAAESLRKALALSPDLVSAQRGLVALQLSQDRVPQALDIAREMQKRRPNDAAGYVLEGDIRSTRKEWSLAAAAYARAVKQGGSSDAAIKLHAALLADNKPREAAAAQAGWLQAHGDDARYRIYLAESYLRQGDNANALRQYRALLDKRPDDPAAAQQCRGDRRQGRRSARDRVRGKGEHARAQPARHHGHAGHAARRQGRCAARRRSPAQGGGARARRGGDPAQPCARAHQDGSKGCGEEGARAAREARRQVRRPAGSREAPEDALIPTHAKARNEGRHQRRRRRARLRRAAARGRVRQALSDLRLRPLGAEGRALPALRGSDRRGELGGLARREAAQGVDGPFDPAPRRSSSWSRCRPRWTRRISPISGRWSARPRRWASTCAAARRWCSSRRCIRGRPRKCACRSSSATPA